MPIDRLGNNPLIGKYDPNQKPVGDLNSIPEIKAANKIRDKIQKLEHRSRRTKYCLHDSAMIRAAWRCSHRVRWHRSTPSRWLRRRRPRSW